MSNISSIEWNEFPERKPRPLGLSVRPEYEAVRALKIGEAIKFPCTWKHYISQAKQDTCYGKAGVYGAGRKYDPYKKFQAACVDKVIYVRRVKDIREEK